MKKIDLLEEAISKPAVVEKGIEKVESEIIGEELTIRQKKFCQLYALDMRFLGHGINSYLEVYDIDTSKPGWYNAAAACASALLKRPIIFNYINALLTEQGLSNENADAQLLFVMNQHGDLTNKMQAIKEYNKLKQRITEKIEHSGTLTIGSILAEIQEKDSIKKLENKVD